MSQSASRARGPIEPPDGIVALGPEVTDALQALVVELERKEDREVAAALDSALRLVPGPVRGMVRKVLTS